MLNITADELQKRTEQAIQYHENLMRSLAEEYFEKVFDKTKLIDAANERKSSVDISIPDYYIEALQVIINEFSRNGFTVTPRYRRGDFWIGWRKDLIPEGPGFVD